MQKGQKWLVLVFLVLIFFIPASIADAQGSQFPGDTGPSGIVPCGDATDSESNRSCNACHLVKLTQDGINFMVYASIFVATLMIVFAGFKYVTAGGDTGKVSDAHKIFRTVIVGLIIILAAWLIVDLLMKTFLNDQDFGPWNTILCSTSSGTSKTSSTPSSSVVYCYQDCVAGTYRIGTIYNSGSQCAASCPTTCRTFEEGQSCSP